MYNAVKMFAVEHFGGGGEVSGFKLKQVYISKTLNLPEHNVYLTAL